MCGDVEFRSFKAKLTYTDDKAVSDEEPFEGPEKLLEIWFGPAGDKLPEGFPVQGLRRIPRRGIKQMLGEVNCSIISVISSPLMDAYLLSESSLFVFKHKMILKTCGRTTTLFALEPLLNLARKYCHYGGELQDVYRVFYSRRTFMFPAQQHEIHRAWPNETLWLGRYFCGETARDYIVGNVGRDHWHLYVNGNEGRDERGKKKDQTLEILMSGLDREVCKKFGLSNYNDTSRCGYQMLKDMGIDGIITAHKKRIDDSYAFTPCGFSSNSIIDDEYYYTMHVTPENGWSYASFESNVPYDDKARTISEVVRMLKPASFFYTIVCEEQIKGMNKMIPLNDYTEDDRIVGTVGFGYEMVYSHNRRNVGNNGRTFAGCEE